MAAGLQLIPVADPPLHTKPVGVSKKSSHWVFTGLFWTMNMLLLKFEDLTQADTVMSPVMLKAGTLTDSPEPSKCLALLNLPVFVIDVPFAVPALLRPVPGRRPSLRGRRPEGSAGRARSHGENDSARRLTHRREVAPVRGADTFVSLTMNVPR